MIRSIHLGVDVGGTASRWVACDADGAILARGKVQGATGHVFNPVERERLLEALHAIAADLSGHSITASGIVMGMTGYGAAVAREVTELCTSALGVPADGIVLIDDMTLAYAANFQPGEGYLISAGTGSIGLHIGNDESYVRVGGRGILIDDAGSGSWIALKALDTLYRIFDRTGSFAAMQTLADEVFAVIGRDDWAGVRQFVYGGDRGAIGALSVALGRAAGKGDATALSILRSAGEELALLAQALTARVGHRPIGFIGGVFDLHPTLRERVEAVLIGEDLRFLQSDAALAAAQLSRDTQSSWRRIFAAGPLLG